MHRLQVQFRLRQLSKADDRTRDLLLKDLERFAFSGGSGAGPPEQGEGGLSYDTAADSEKVVRLGGEIEGKGWRVCLAVMGQEQLAAPAGPQWGRGGDEGGSVV